jgi:hypothetical protein
MTGLETRFTRRLRRLSFATMPFALKSSTVLLEPGSLARPCFVL